MPSLLDVEPIYCAEQIVVPPELPDILKAYTKEVIRNQPENIFEFSANYFAQFVSSNAAENTLEQLMQLVVELNKSDTEGTGLVDAEQIRAGCAAVGYPDSLLDKVLALQGHQASGGVDYTEFIVLAFTLEAESMMQVVQMIFTAFDPSKEEKLDVENFMRYFGHLSKRDKRLSQEVVTSLRHHLIERSNERGGFITYEDFCDAPAIVNFS